jgi:putative transposase
MPFIKIYIHLVWSTKNRIPFLHSQEIRQKVWHHIKENSKLKNIFIDYVNGYNDHCHCLISLGSDQNIEKIVQLIKGESSFWINKTGIINAQFTNNKFEWQNDYFAVSVSESALEKVRNYIINQEQHHSKISFNEEFEKFMNQFNESK